MKKDLSEIAGWVGPTKKGMGVPGVRGPGYATAQDIISPPSVVLSLGASLDNPDSVLDRYLIEDTSKLTRSGEGSFTNREQNEVLDQVSSPIRREVFNRHVFLISSSVMKALNIDEIDLEGGKAEKDRDKTIRSNRLIKIHNQALLSGLAYCISSCSMILVNKYVLSSYDFNAGISLMLYQNLVSVIIVSTLSCFGIISTEPLTWRLIHVWLPVNILFVGMLITSIFSLKYINVAMVTVLKNVTNVITALGEMYLFKKRHDTSVWAALFLMIISAISGGITDLSFHAVGYTWQIINCFLTASYSLTLRRVMDTAKLVTKSGNLNEFSMVLLNNILSLPLGVLLIFVFKEVDYLFETPLLRSPIFWLVITSSGLLGLAISFTSMWFLHQTGATTYSLVGSLNKIPLSVAGILLFKVPTSLENSGSIFFGRALGFTRGFEKHNRCSGVVVQWVCAGDARCMPFPHIRRPRIPSAFKMVMGTLHLRVLTRTEYFSLGLGGSSGFRKVSLSIRNIRMLPFDLLKLASGQMHPNFYHLTTKVEGFNRDDFEIGVRHILSLYSIRKFPIEETYFYLMARSEDFHLVISPTDSIRDWRSNPLFISGEWRARDSPDVPIGFHLVPANSEPFDLTSRPSQVELASPPENALSSASVDSPALAVSARRSSKEMDRETPHKTLPFRVPAQVGAYGSGSLASGSPSSSPPPNSSAGLIPRKRRIQTQAQAETAKKPKPLPVSDTTPPMASPKPKNVPGKGKEVASRNPGRAKVLVFESNFFVGGRVVTLQDCALGSVQVALAMIDGV
ncbi:hypothetical protein HHK36_009249 [Tetracentron sinense]|uniref:Sugar phosphate transporter domain-containing protein n=1 Tax=Tetracentron sinense TaxID=13715 RepID=A0A834ZD42_TETSI|nr:hypothetical protein HHK36_009249 [Tetracentron sinense]